MAHNVTQKLIASHLVEGEMTPGSEIGLKIDQTLTQDATGTLVMLEFEAMGVPRVKTELSAQYVDHNLLQTDYKNPDDHLFLYSACRKFGVYYSRPGNGVSHVLHMERFGIPGKTLVGSDSHTPAAGLLGMLSFGAGGLEVALAMAGEPLYINMPEVLGVKITGELPDWVSAKDVVLEMLRRYDVDGCVGKVIEYYGPGLANLSAMDRHVIANMGTEMGATSTVFPSDDEVRRFMATQGREDDWTELLADDGAEYDAHDEIELGGLEPLIALPSSPGNVVPVSEVAGKKIYQSYIGSSANPGFRDFAVPAMMVKGKQTHPEVSFDVNPTSRQILENLTEQGYLAPLIRSGGRLHQAGCNGCIGMGQAPATGRISLRTVPRNFPGRSGTDEDAVYLCSPETATASALTGVITDPRTLEQPYPKFREPDTLTINDEMLEPPAAPDEEVEIIKGPNVQALPSFNELPDALKLPVLLKLGDDISTDEIMPAGSNVLPYRSNVPKISEFVFYQLDPDYTSRALDAKEHGHGSMIVGGDNYGQGSSREHAAIAPRYLGVRVVLAKSFARIHWQNLNNFGVLPLTFKNPDDYDRIEQGDVITLERLHDTIAEHSEVDILNETKQERYTATHAMSPRQVDMILSGSLISLMRDRDTRQAQA
ncbi:MAG: aconitate hydratase [Trueperaceae bacterium]|nr:aconitate hydratase [Trueperaceae bacterium]